MMLTPLQLPSVHHNPSCDGSAKDAEKRQENVKREFGQQSVAKKRLASSKPFDKLKKEM